MSTVTRAATQTTVSDSPPAAFPRPSTATSFARWSRRVALTGWLVWTGLLVWAFQAGVLTSVESLREFVAGFGPLAPVVYALLAATEAVFPVVPGSITIIAAPVLFGPVVGTIAAYVATCLGSFAVFAISRHVGHDLLTTRFRPATVERYLGWLEDPRFTRWFAIAIALPIAPDDLLCYLAGLSGMRTRTFVLIILLLKPWGLLAYTFGVLLVMQHLLPWLSF